MHMKNRRKGAGRILALAVLMTVSSSLPAFAASWKKDQYGWVGGKGYGRFPAPFASGLTETRTALQNAIILMQTDI